MNGQTCLNWYLLLHEIFYIHKRADFVLHDHIDFTETEIMVPVLKYVPHKDLTNFRGGNPCIYCRKYDRSYVSWLSSGPLHMKC